LKRLSIVHTESSLDWTDQQARILAEAQGLIRRGHEVKLLCPSEARIHAEAARRSVPAIALPIARKRPLGVKVLYEWLKRNRCDVVCTHGSTDAWLAALALLALGRPFPMVYAPHVPAPPPTNAATRWLYTRAAKRVVTHSEAPEKELAERMEKIYLQVRR
jgi:Glycosyltransferase Family 4